MELKIKNGTEFCNIIYGDEDDYSYIDENGVVEILKEKAEHLKNIYDIIEENDLVDTDELYSLGDTINLIESLEPKILKVDDTDLKEKLINRLYNYWEESDDDKEKLLEEITDNVNNGTEGAYSLIDWCVCEYDMAKEKYANIHNLTEDELSKIIDDNYGNLDFMADDIDYLYELDKIWDICNWFLDYCNNDMTKDELLEEL